LCKKKAYATEIGGHKLQWDLKMKNDDFQSIFQLSLCAHTRRKVVRNPQWDVLEILCKPEYERKRIIFIVFQQLIIAKYLDLSELDFPY